MSGRKWDVFHAYRVYGGWDDLPLFCMVVLTSDPKVFVKTNKPLPVGSVVHLGVSHSGYYVDRSGLGLRGVVTRIISRDDFQDVDLLTADAETLAAIGEWMCGVCLHGQWFGDLLVHVSASLKASNA